MDTIFFTSKNETPPDVFKDIMYGKFVCTVCSIKAEPNQTWLTLREDCINYPEDVGTPTVDMLLVKLLLNSIISTNGAWFMTINFSNFYLNTPLKWPKYVQWRLHDKPKKIIQKYGLLNKTTTNGFVYVKVQKEMYGLPLAGILTQEHSGNSKSNIIIIKAT